MTSSSNQALERIARRIPIPEPAYERLRRRQNRKQRNRRIRAGVVGIAVFAATFWIVTTGGALDRTQTRDTPGHAAPSVPVLGVPEVDYVIDLNTGMMTPLPEAIIRSLGGPLFANQYAVSPDGSLVAYVGTGDETQIFIAGIDGTGARQVTHDPNGAWSPAWSPDGTRIAYEALDSGHVHSLFVLDVASSESTHITDVKRRHSPLEPQFAPDGSSLVYTGGSDDHPVIRTAPVAGGRSTLLIGPGEGLRDADNGSLSPDGSLVTFLGSQFGHSEPQRWVANADGTERRLLPSVYGIPCRSNPAGTWSTDGSRLVCAEASRVIVIDIATGGASAVAQGRGAIWLDDHTLLVSV